MKRQPKHIESKPKLATMGTLAVFGRKNRPSTPVKGLINGQFQNEDLYREKNEAHIAKVSYRIAD